MIDSRELSGGPMRIILLSCLALALSGCASDRSRFRHGPPRSGPGIGSAPRRLFISPMGEPFRADGGEGDPQDRWFQGADTNGNGNLTLAEFSHDAARFFAVLDRNDDGEIDPDEIKYYETVLAPEIRVGGGPGSGRAGGPGAGRRGGGGGGNGMGRGGGQGRRGGGGQGAAAGISDSDSRQRQAPGREGAARFSYFDLPEPVIAADTNFNRGVSSKEFEQAAAQRFAALDTNGDGSLTLGELPKISRAATLSRKGIRRRSRP